MKTEENAYSYVRKTWVYAFFIIDFIVITAGYYFLSFINYSVDIIA